MDISMLEGALNVLIGAFAVGAGLTLGAVAGAWVYIWVSDLIEWVVG